MGASPLQKIRITYSQAHYGKSLFWYMTDFLFAYYLAEIYFLPASTIGILLFAFLIWDAITDPLLVLVIGRKEVSTKWLLKNQFYGALLSGITFLMIFFKPEGDISSLTIYALISGLSFRTAYTIYDIPQNTLLARLSTDRREQLTLSSLRAAFSALASLSVALASAIILRQENSQNQANVFLLTALLFILASTLSSFLLVIGCKRASEPRSEPPPPSSPPPQLDAITELFPYWPLFLATFCLSTGWPLFCKLVPFYTTYVLDKPAEAGLLFTGISLASLASQFIFLPIGRRFTPSTLAFGLSASVVILGICFFVFRNNAYHLGSISASLMGALVACSNVLIWTALANILSNQDSPNKRDVLAFGVFTFSSKIAFACSGLLLGVILEGIGYSQGASLSSHAKLSLVLFMSAFPAFSVILALLLSLRPISP